MKNEIEVVAIERLNKVIEQRKPLGLFLSREPRKGRKRGMFIAVDNSTGDLWIEEFEKLSDAEEWLSRKIEVGV